MFYIIAFVFGSIWGSFANVCIYRLPANKNVATGRSCCPNCNNLIKWYDNIPIVSFLFLQGVCRNCSKKIISNTKNQITNIWIVEFLLKRLLSNCLKYSINDQLVIDNLILNEKEIVIHILNIKNINELLELLDDLNYRLIRVKTFNSSLEFEIFQFLNRFH